MWFLGLNFVLGGAATIALTAYLKRLNQTVVSKVLIAIILGLCIMSVVLVIPTAVRIYINEDWEGLSSIKFHC
jgi:hypothetical protein